MSLWPISAAFFIIALSFAALPYTTGNPVTQSLYFGIASAFFSVFLGLMVVNVVLSSKDRKRAAAPLLRLIAELARFQHNWLFIKLGRDTFGIDKFNRLLSIYQKNGRSAEAFTPENLNALVEMVLSKKTDIMKSYSEIEHNARDMAYILGWGYDAKILAAILNTRTDVVKFLRLIGTESLSFSSKQELIAAFLDVDAALGACVEGLAAKLGVQIRDVKRIPS